MSVSLPSGAYICPPGALLRGSQGQGDNLESVQSAVLRDHT